ncbi:threonine-phosphate decarboxylase [Xaviernesmea oryzae]|uniref:threonine-phosphate decarboxylase n=2 Tax=Xaviernesmea oryzae TaxID=464029 RepID=A0A1Q9B0M1_9HYPH|nr:threonine-phosphate decarboxylase [Xaviernesmea oryzae]
MRHYGGTHADWLDVSTGLNPCPPELPAIPRDAWLRLPDESADIEARHAARDLYGTRTILPLPVAGTQAAIQCLPGILPLGARAAILSPTYGEYRRVFEAGGHPIDLVEDLDALGPAHRLVVVVNPNNPTGRLVRRDVLLGLAEKLAASDGYLVVDEAFADVAPDESVADAVEDHSRLIVLRSLGKVFGFAGVRLGFVVAAKPIQARLQAMLGPWSVSGPALAVGAALMRGDLDTIRATIARRAQGLDMALSAAKVTVLGGTPLFRLVDVAHARLVHERMAQAHILTRFFDAHPTWLRLGLTPSAQADLRLSTALCDALAPGGWAS